MGFIDMKFDMSPNHTPTENDQSLNKSRCQPSLRPILFTLNPLWSFSISLISASYLSLLLLWSWHHWFSLPFHLCFLSLAFPIIPLSIIILLSGAWHALCQFNCDGLCRIEEDERGVGWGGQCRERCNEWEREEWQNLLTSLPSFQAVLSKAEGSKWVMGQFLVGLYNKSSSVF